MTKKEYYTEACKDVSDYELDVRIKGYSAEAERVADSAIINKWLSGNLLTFEQMNSLKLAKADGFDSEAVKKTVIYIPKYDKKTKKFLGMEKADRFFNKMVIGIEKRIKNAVITDQELILSRGQGKAENSAELDFKTSELYSVRSELRGLRGEYNRREAERYKAEREKRGLKYLSLKEIWDKANTDKEFTEAECEQGRERVLPEVDVSVEQDKGQKKKVEVVALSPNCDIHPSAC